MFDKGEVDNLKIYGSKTSPVFDLSKVNVPVALFCGKQDLLVPPEDYMWLKAQLD